MKRFLLLVYLFSSISAHAADPARPIDMTQVLVDADGKPIVDPFQMTKDDPECLKCGHLTLGRAIEHALFAALPDDKTPAEQKWARGVLAEKIKEDPHATLTAEELVVVKRVVGEVYSARLLVAMYPLLDPAAVPPSVK